MIWNTGFDEIVQPGAAGGQEQFGIFFEDHEGRIQRLTEAEGNEVSYNPETVDRNPIGQAAPSTEVRSYNLTLDKDIIIKKDAPNYDFFARLKRMRPTGDNAKLRVYLVDFRLEEVGAVHHRYYAEMMNMTVTITTVNETDGLLSVNFAQDGDYTIGTMGRTDDNSTPDDETSFTYGFTSSRQIPVESITPSKEAVSVPVGGTARVFLLFAPLGCPYDFTVKSTDETKAAASRWNQSVDIRGRAVGTTTVTVTSTTGGDTAKTATISVTVTAN